MAFGVAGELLDQVRTNALDGTFNSSEDCEWSPLALGDAAEVLASIGRLAATQLVPSDRKTMHYLRVDGERLQPSHACLIAGDTFAIGDTQVDALALLTFVANRVLIVPFEPASGVHLVVHAIDLPQLGYRLEVSLAVGARGCLTLLAFDRLKGMHDYLF